MLPLLKDRLNPSLDSAILISSENFRNIKDYILTSEKEAFNKIDKDSSGNIRIFIEDIRTVKKSLRGFLLKNLLEKELKGPVFSRDIKKIFSLITAQTGKYVELSRGIVVFKERRYLKIISGKNRERDDYNENIYIGETRIIPAGMFSIKKCDRDSIVYSNNKNKEYISADGVSTEFTIRRWREGDSFQPLGMSGFKKISDFLNEQKVESSCKKNHLILMNRKKVVWIIGLRIDNRFKVTSSTQKILELCLN